MAKFLELNEAAQLLGVTPDKLVEMRSNGDIRGFRDGASWKFKEDELERAKEEMAADGLDDTLNLAGDGSSELGFADAENEDDESILVTEEELGQSGDQTSSTIIGKKGSDEPADSDLKLTEGSPGSDLTLADGSDLALGSESGGSDLAFVADEGSDLTLDGGSGIDSAVVPHEPTAGSSIVGVGPEKDSSVVGGEKTKKDSSVVGDSSAEGSSVLAYDESAAGSSVIGETGSSVISGGAPGDSGSSSDVTLVPGVGDSDVALVPDPGSDKGGPAGVRPDSDILVDDSELTLEGPDAGGTGNLELAADTGGTGSALSDLDMALDSELALSDDDDVVLSGSGTGSDLSLSAADSGINLSSPTDSGLSLEADSGINLQSPTDSGLSLDEEPLDLGGSSISSLELPEDEEVVGLDDALESLDEVDAEPAAVKKDEEFLLSPSDEMFMDESDSGSQVIALEDSEAFDQDAATLVPGEGGQALLAETAGLEQQLDSLESGGEPATPIGAPAPTPAAPAPDLPETPYSIWNIIGLLMIVMFLSLAAVLMTDMVKNMWAWQEGGHDISTGISKGLTKALFGKDA